MQLKQLSSLVSGIAVLVSFQTAQAYSTISEDVIKAFIQSPLDVLPAGPTTAAPINLLKWNVSPQDPPTPTERYNRLHHYGEWITPSQKSDDCVDTRNRVLQRDSETPIEMRPNNTCKVGAGTWYDPYTNNIYKKAEDVQIDHVVPLKDSYINGAWKWNYQTRCTYANYMGFRDHLKPVSGPENMFKSDNSPAEYMPPNNNYKCEYLKVWLSIKLIWKLGMQRAEAEQIKKLVDEYKCDTAQFVFDSTDLRKQRETIAQSLSLCPTEPQPSHYQDTPQPGPH